jgi:hypothetical protein
MPQKETLFARILSTSFSSVSIFSVCCYSKVSISMDRKDGARRYKEYHSVPSHASQCAPPPRLGGAHSPAGEGLGESQFRRHEKKLSTLPNSVGGSVAMNSAVHDHCLGKPVYLSASFPESRIHLQVDVRNWYILHLKNTIQYILSLVCHSKQGLIYSADNFGPRPMFR